MRRFMRRPGTAVLLGGASCVFVFIFMVNGRPSLAAPAAAGVEDVYLDKCSVCHAKDGSGNTAKGRKLKVKDLRSPEAQKLTEAEMIDIVAKGKGKDMDAFEKELGGPDKVKEMVIYYRSLAK